MTTSFTQKHVEDIIIDDLTPEDFLSIAIETSKSLGWALGNIEENGFTAYTTNGVFNWNAEIRLKINNGSANFMSQSRNIRTVEFGKDKLNIENFIAKFNDIKKALLPVEIVSPYLNMQSNVA